MWPKLWLWWSLDQGRPPSKEDHHPESKSRGSRLCWSSPPERDKAKHMRIANSRSTILHFTVPPHTRMVHLISYRVFPPWHVRMHQILEYAMLMLCQKIGKLTSLRFWILAGKPCQTKMNRITKYWSSSLLSLSKPFVLPTACAAPPWIAELLTSEDVPG